MGTTAAKPPLPASMDRQLSQNPSRASDSTQPTMSHDGSQRMRNLPPIHPKNEQMNPRSTRPTVFRNGSQKSSADTPPAPYQNGTGGMHPSNQMPSSDSYPSNNSIIKQNEMFSSFSDGYNSSRYPQNVRANETASPMSLYRSRDNLTRGAVDLVSRSRMLRYCQLYSGPGQAFGFRLKTDGDKHIIHNIQHDSPASNRSTLLFSQISFQSFSASGSR